MKVVIRADAYSELGTGHVMRCLALAQGIKDNGGDVVFVTYCESEGLLERLKKETFCIHKLQAPGSLEKSLQLISEEKPDWVVLDGYHFDTEYQKAVKDAGHRLLYIDDFAHLDHYYADILLNQDYGAGRFHYSIEPCTKLLIGTDYVFLRREFLQYTGFKRTMDASAHKILIMMGGVDIDNYTLKVLKDMQHINVPLSVRVIIGGANPHYKSISREAPNSRHTVKIFRAVEDMPAMMAWADVAISAGGTSIWELAFMGLPAVLYVTAENQRHCVKALNEDGFFMTAGRTNADTFKDLSQALSELLVNKNLRDIMSRKLKTLVDGRGIYRTVNEMKSNLEGTC